ncbi:hypothetical protein AXX12_06780 [Anaerosporomusa subterranea]|uniref:Uncharacterized protein n=1 Tax=Anaerosporomusa subterranea TaxID=1794912 RepID=A0A154BQB8_ANASB|nr:hypothetical protein [Anaerosporomusa subterranea]KYZ76142.1 hypothetical protein AXX12_06780 [Anaerosporomusa subterranea]
MDTNDALFWWKYSPNVLRNKGDIIVPLKCAIKLPSELSVDFDGVAHSLIIDSRNRIRGTGAGDAIFNWLSQARLRLGDSVPVFFDQTSNKLIFDSKKAIRTIVQYASR